MPDRRKNDPEIGAVNDKYPNISIHKGANIQIGKPTNQSENWLAMSPPAGYYAGNYIGVPLSEFTAHIGLTPQKIAYNNTILGIKGTNTGAGNAKQGDVLEGKTFSTGVNGNTGFYNAPGTMKNRTKVDTAIGQAGTDNAKAVHKATGWHLRKPTNQSTTWVQLAPPHGYWNDGAFTGIPIADFRTGIGLSASKIANGQKVLELTGTYKGLGNATAAQVLKGKTFSTASLSNATGTLAVQSVINFSAAAQSINSIRITWNNPTKGPYQGVQIRMSTNGYPGVGGGTLKYTGTGSSTAAGGTSYVNISGLVAGTTYYFTCYAYVTNLGNGTAVNVSAKTKGLMIYNAGTTPYTWDGATNSNGVLTVGAVETTQAPHTIANGFQTCRIDRGINLSPYSRLNIEFYDSSDSDAGYVNGIFYLLDYNDYLDGHSGLSYGNGELGWSRTSGAKKTITFRFANDFKWDKDKVNDLGDFRISIGFGAWNSAWLRSKKFEDLIKIIRMWAD